MFNSFSLFLVFIGVTIFGYLSLVRILYKNQFSNRLNKEVLSVNNGLSLLQNLGQNILFAFIPAVGIALYWGWAPGLLWFFINHFLIISSYNLISSGTQNKGIASFTHLLEGKPTSHTKIIQGLLYCYLIFLAAVCIYFLAELINKNTGILFAIAALLPAHFILQSNENSWIKIPLALATLVVGVIFSQKLGLLFYGDWTPFASTIPWLHFNNTTLVASLLVISGFWLTNNSTFSAQLNLFSGAIIAILFTFLIYMLCVSYTVIDAPVHSQVEGSSSRPAFIFLCALLFPGLSNIIIKALTSTPKSIAPETSFALKQTTSLINLLIVIAAFVSLSTANGIGAWKSHYLIWPSSLSLLEQFTLVINNLSATLFATQSNDLIELLFISLCCIIGLNTTLVILSRINMSQRLNQTPTLTNTKLSGWHALPVLLVSFYLIKYNATINIWLLFGLLNWVLFSWLFNQFCLRALEKKLTLQNQILAGISLSIIAIGFIQTTYLTYHWWLDEKYLFVFSSLSLLVIASLLLFKSCKTTVNYFFTKSEVSIFE